MEFLHFGLDPRGSGLQEREVVQVARGVVYGVIVPKLPLDHVGGKNTVRLVRAHQLHVHKVLLQLEGEKVPEERQSKDKMVSRWKGRSNDKPRDFVKDVGCRNWIEFHSESERKVSRFDCGGNLQYGSYGNQSVPDLPFTCFLIDFIGSNQCWIGRGKKYFVGQPNSRNSSLELHRGMVANQFYTLSHKTQTPMSSERLCNGNERDIFNVGRANYCRHSSTLPATVSRPAHHQVLTVWCECNQIKPLTLRLSGL